MPPPPLRWRIVAANASSPIAGSSRGSAAWRTPTRGSELTPRCRELVAAPSADSKRSARDSITSGPDVSCDPGRRKRAIHPSRRPNRCGSERVPAGASALTCLPLLNGTQTSERSPGCKDELRERTTVDLLLVVADDAAAQHERQQEERASSGPHRRAASPSCGSRAPRRESRRPRPPRGRPRAGSGRTPPPSSRSPTPCRSRCTG